MDGHAVKSPPGTFYPKVTRLFEAVSGKSKIIDVPIYLPWVPNAAFVTLSSNATDPRQPTRVRQIDYTVAGTDRVNPVLGANHVVVSKDQNLLSFDLDTGQQVSAVSLADIGSPVRLQLDGDIIYVLTCDPNSSSRSPPEVFDVSDLKRTDKRITTIPVDDVPYAPAFTAGLAVFAPAGDVDVARLVAPDSGKQPPVIVNFTGTLPSGDGKVGGDFTTGFEVQKPPKFVLDSRQFRGFRTDAREDWDFPRSTSSPLVLAGVNGDGRPDFVRAVFDPRGGTNEYHLVAVTLQNPAVHDAACAAWSLKRYYDGWRPIEAIRFMGQLGQSSCNGEPISTPPTKPVFRVCGAASMCRWTIDRAPPGRLLRAIRVGAGPPVLRRLHLADARDAEHPPFGGGWMRGELRHPARIVLQTAIVHGPERGFHGRVRGVLPGS